MEYLNIACIVGTRPEVIKMAPIIRQLKQQANKKINYKIDIICTAQHRELMDDMLSMFELSPQFDLNIMRENQSLSELTANLFLSLDRIIKENHYSMVIAQGDTTTTFVAAQIAFFHRIAFAHVEAGLRSHDFYQPFPEEMNRALTAKLATLHFAPTLTEKENLLKEHIPEKNIFITGNTVIDSLYFIAKKQTPLPFLIEPKKRIILITLHRRENFGEPLNSIFSALIDITKKIEDIIIVYPVHPNPNVRKIAYELLSHKKNILLVDPLPYDVFVTLMKAAYFIVTDSGGLQEEAPALNKPVLILREKTERTLLIKLQLGKLIGTKTETIFCEMQRLLTDQAYYASMINSISPYGDGQAAKRIIDEINRYFLGCN